MQFLASTYFSDTGSLFGDTHWNLPLLVSLQSFAFPFVGHLLRVVVPKLLHCSTSDTVNLAPRSHKKLLASGRLTARGGHGWYPLNPDRGGGSGCDATTFPNAQAEPAHFGFQRTSAPHSVPAPLESGPHDRYSRATSLDRNMAIHAGQRPARTEAFGWQRLQFGRRTHRFFAPTHSWHGKHSSVVTAARCEPWRFLRFGAPPSTPTA